MFCGYVDCYFELRAAMPRSEPENTYRVQVTAGRWNFKKAQRFLEFGVGCRYVQARRWCFVYVGCVSHSWSKSYLKGACRCPCSLVLALRPLEPEPPAVMARHHGGTRGAQEHARALAHAGEVVLVRPLCQASWCVEVRVCTAGNPVLARIP